LIRDDAGRDGRHVQDPLRDRFVALSKTLDGPPGSAHGGSSSTPFSVTVVAGSANFISAPAQQVFNKSTYNFVSWSDGGPQSHTIVAPAVNTTYTATYRKR